MIRIYSALKKAQEEKEQETGPGRLPEDRESQTTQRREKEGASSEPVETPIPRQVEPSVRPELHVPGLIGLGAIDERLVALTQPESVAAEQFKKIRTVLSQHRLAKGHNIIMVTSSLHEEGKTLTACNLGVTITLGLDHGAILVDCDLRKPSVDQRFGFNGRPGLTEFLLGRKELFQVIHEVPGLKLKIIPAGRSPKSPAELLSSDKMANFLKDLKASYKDHYIILDTTPILSTAESASLANMVTGIILVIMAGKTSRDAIRRAVKEIAHDKVIGVVLNNLKSSEGYHSKYYHGYNHRSSNPSGIGTRLKRFVT